MQEIVFICLRIIQQYGMKQCTAILLALVFLMLSMKDWVTFATFKVNQDRIAATSCENRAIPQVMCYGVCVLGDQLAELHEVNPSDPAPIVAEYKEIVLYPPFAPLLKHTEESVTPTRSGYQNTLQDRLWAQSLYRPPIFG